MKEQKYLPYAIVLAFIITGFTLWGSVTGLIVFEEEKEVEVTYSDPNYIKFVPPGSFLIQKEEFLLHNTREDCWFLIENKVYDLSKHAQENQELEKYCGKLEIADEFFNEFEIDIALISSSGIYLSDLEE
jgi:hypothetical protein